MQVVGLIGGFQTEDGMRRLLKVPILGPYATPSNHGVSDLSLRREFRECLAGGSGPESTGTGDVKLGHAPTAQGDFFLFLSFLTFGYYPPLLPLFRPP